MQSTAGRRLGATVSLAAFGAITVVHLLLVVLGVGQPALRVTQGLLMPVLAVYAFAALSNGARLPWRVGLPLGAALACSWVGDLAPGFLADDAGFLAMVAAFFVAQLAWIGTLWPWRDRSILRTAWPMSLAYVGIAVAVLLLTLPGAGALGFAVVPYAAVLAIMGVLATGVGWRGTLGGLLFILSDALIAVYEFAPLLNPGDLPRGLTVMSTYCAAQVLLVAGVRHAVERDAVERDAVAGDAAQAG